VKVTNYLTDKFSFSKVACFSRCPRKFFYKYVMRMKENTSPWLLFGRGAHGGQEVDNYAKLRGERLSVEQVLEAAVAEFEEETEKENTGRELKDAFAEEHARQLEIFEDSGERAKIVPVAGTVEGAFQLELMVGDGDGPKAPALVEGYTDVVSQAGEDEPRVMIDYKSAGRPVSEREAAEHLQLGLEALGGQAEAAQIVSFVKGGKQKPTTKVSKAHPVTQSRIQKILAWLADGIHGIRRGVKSGDFPKCDPACHWCSAQACDFYGLCYPEKQPDLHKWVELGEIRPSGSLPPAEWRMSRAGRMEAERCGPTEPSSSDSTPAA
jgi:hypothetical protein